MLWAFSSKLLFCHSLAVSVNVGGKQYLLGLYDTAGQVQPFLFSFFFKLWLNAKHVKDTRWCTHGLCFLSPTLSLS